MLKRVISLLLSMAMVLSLMPMNITAAAEEIPEEETTAEETVAPAEEETAAGEESAPAATEPEETAAVVSDTVIEETAPVYMASATGAGTCGATMFWSVDEAGLLTIWGRGVMDDYTNTNSAPWSEYSSSIKEVSIADTVTSIGALAFYGCSKITSITIPASVTSIGERAFLGCYGLKTITFEGDAPTLGYTFYDISAVAYFPANNATWTEDIFQNYGGRIAWASTGDDGIVARGLWDTDDTNGSRWVLRNDGTLEFTGTGSMYQKAQSPAWNFFDSQIKKVVVNSGITSVCDNAFASCTNLTEVSLPASLTSIGDSAFASCTAITSIVVPEGVKKIGEGAFASCSNLTDISLPNTLTSIGNYAFSYCTSLTEIDLPESLTKIEYGAFANCPGLTKISIPKGVTYIDSYIVRECPNLAVFELWYTVDLIDYDAFWNCPALRTIIFHGTPAQWNAVEKDSTVTSVLSKQNVYIQYEDPCVDGHTEVIDKAVAATCTTNGKTEGKRCTVCKAVLVAQEVIPAGHDLVNGVCQRCGIITGSCGENLTWTLDTDGILTISGTGKMQLYSTGTAPWYSHRNSVKTVIIEDGVTDIGCGAFYTCTNLTDVEIPDSVTVINDFAFQLCKNLTDVEIPDSVTTIGWAAFANCTKLTSVNIPDSVTRIQESAFTGCTDLTSVTIGKAVSYICCTAFSRCTSLMEFNVSADNASYCVGEDGVLFNKDKTYLVTYPAGKTGAYTVPDTVTEIGYDAFYDCKNLTSVTIPASVARIDECAFYDTGLTEVRFEGDAPELIRTYVGDSLWFGNYNGDTITVYYPADNATWTDEAKNSFNEDSLNWVAYAPYLAKGTCGENLTWTLTEDGVLTISGEGAMAEYSASAYPWYSHRGSIKSIVVEDGVTSIGSYAFFQYTNIISATIGNDVTDIGKFAFRVCRNLLSVRFGDSVATIGEEAFSGAGLTNVTLPASVTSIGAAAFRCSNLREIWVEEGNPAYSHDENGILFNKDKTMLVCFPGANTGTYVIPNSVTKIGESAFSSNSGLTGVTIPDSVTHIGNNAFNGCSQLTEVVMGNSVSEIGTNAFYGCYGLSGIEIPDSVVTIGDSAFEGCEKIAAVTMGSSVAAIGNSAFYDCFALKEITFTGDAPDFSDTAFYEISATVYYPAGNETWTEDMMQDYGGTITWMADCTNGHTEVIDEAVDATCTTDGKTEGKHCSVCGEVLIAQEVIPAGHTVENGICTLCKVYGTCGENLTWTLDAEGTLTISGEGAMYDYMAHTNNAPWTASRVAVKAVVFQNGVTGIGADAFNNHDSLASVTIPDSVTDIGDHAFINCDSLTAIEIPASVTEIENAVFFDCDSLDNVVIPDSVVRIGVDAFYHCSGMTKLTVGNAVATIGDAAFGYCASLTEIVIPDSVVSIGNGVLRGCGKLEAITVPFIGDREKTSADSSQYPLGYLFGTGSYEGGEATSQFYYDDPATDSKTNQLFYIPAALKSVTVTGGEILLGAFSNCANLTEIVLPEDITAIGVQAFDSCSGLKSMSVPKNVTEIGQSAFRDCVSLYTVILPEGIKTIAEDTFSGCSSLMQITIPNTVTTIGEYAFYCCRDLANVTFGDGLTEIGYRGFFGCESLTSLNLGAAVVSIGEAAFEDCTGLKTVTFPDGLETVGDYAFCNCSRLTDVVIPETVTAIGDFAFRDCKALKKMFFEGNAPQIATNSFDNVTAKAYYPAVDETWTEEVRQNHGGNITWVAYYEGDCGENLHWLYSEDGFLTISGSGAMDNYATATECPWYVHRAGVQSLTVENGVTTIGDRAFYSCAALTNVSIGDTVTSIGSYAFRGCAALESVTIPESVTEIKASAFRACSNLAEVTFEGDAPTVGSFVFNECAENLTVNCYEGKTGFDAAPWTGMNVVVNHVGQWIVDKEATCTTDGSRHIYCSYCQETITETIIGKHNYVEGICSVCNEVELIDSDWYNGMTWKLDVFGTLTISGNTSMQSSPWRTKHADIILRVVIEEGITSIGYDAFNGCSSLTEIVIPESVTSIGLSAFYNCSGLTEIVIPESVTSIGDSAFSSCSSLTEIMIPESVTGIGDSAFSGCSSLKEIVIPESVTVIGSAVFQDCSSLTEIVIPESVTVIGDSAFYNSGLTEIVIPDSVTSIGNCAFYNCSSLKEIVIPESVTVIGSAVFQDCSSLTEIVIPDSVTVIGDSAFYNSGLTEIVIPESVTVIGSAAFQDCSSLTEIVIPDSVTSIGGSAFYGCSNLTDVVIGDVVTSIDDAVFYGCNSLTNVVVGNSVTSIGDSAFYNSGLTEIVIPNRVTSIGDCVFECCYDLKEITFKGGAPSFGENVFSDVYATAYYPSGNETWTSDVMQNYGGNITWVAACTNGHTEVIDEAVEATCTTDGKTEGKHCSACGEILVAQEVIPASHDLKEVPAVEPTVNTEGNIAHFACEVCGKMFADGEGTKELSADEVILQKLPGGAVVNGKNYETVAEALADAKPGETVQLLRDTVMDMTVVSEGVALDLNGYTLEADYFVAFNGANVEDNSENNTGLLKVAADRVMIGRNNSQLPVWNGEGYGFTTVKYRRRLEGYDSDSLHYAFLPIFKEGATALLEDGVEGNKVTIEVRVSWKTGLAREYRNLVFNEEQVQAIVGTNGAFTLTFSGFSKLDMQSGITVEALVVSETGVARISNAYVVDVTQAQ